MFLYNHVRLPGKTKAHTILPVSDSLKMKGTYAERHEDLERRQPDRGGVQEAPAGQHEVGKRLVILARREALVGVLIIPADIQTASPNLSAPDTLPAGRREAVAAVLMTPAESRTYASSIPSFKTRHHVLTCPWTDRCPTASNGCAIDVLTRRGSAIDLQGRSIGAGQLWCA